MSYDDANSSIARESRMGTLTGVASAAFARFHCFQKTRIKQIRGTVVVAGTNASAGIDIYNGTTSVGSITVGTNTAGTIVSSGALNTDVAADSFYELRGKANSATMQVALVAEERVLPEAVNSGGP